jgi:hypothetical protein
MQTALLIGAALAAMLIAPSARILMRAGFSPWWALLWLTGPGAVVGVWVFASKRWPELDPLMVPVYSVDSATGLIDTGRRVPYAPSQMREHLAALRDRGRDEPR